jgi:hypothetical protein
MRSSDQAFKKEMAVFHKVQRDNTDFMSKIGNPTWSTNHIAYWDCGDTKTSAILQTNNLNGNFNKHGNNEDFIFSFILQKLPH